MEGALNCHLGPRIIGSALKTALSHFQDYAQSSLETWASSLPVFTWIKQHFGNSTCLAFTSVLVQWLFRPAMRIINIEDAAASDTSWQFMNRRHHQYFNQASDALFTARRFLSGAIPNYDAWSIKYSADEGITYRYGFQNKIWLHILTSRKSPVILSVTIWRNCRDHWR